MHTLSSQSITSLGYPAGSLAQGVSMVGQLASQAMRTPSVRPTRLVDACFFEHPSQLHADLATTGAEAFFSVFVNARLTQAELALDEGDASAAAVCIAETHCWLVSCLCSQSSAGAWQQAALRHSRRTHCALLHHLQESGSHPAIDDALRAGCLSLSIPAPRLH